MLISCTSFVYLICRGRMCNNQVQEWFTLDSDEKHLEETQFQATRMVVTTEAVGVSRVAIIIIVNLIPTKLSWVE